MAERTGISSEHIRKTSLADCVVGGANFYRFLEELIVEVPA